MKKQLLLVMAFVAATFTVNAQTYAVQESDELQAKQKLPPLMALNLHSVTTPMQ